MKTIAARRRLWVGYVCDFWLRERMDTEEESWFQFQVHLSRRWSQLRGEDASELQNTSWSWSCCESIWISSNNNILLCASQQTLSISWIEEYTRIGVWVSVCEYIFFTVFYHFFFLSFGLFVFLILIWCYVPRFNKYAILSAPFLDYFLTFSLDK